MDSFIKSSPTPYSVEDDLVVESNTTDVVLDSCKQEGIARITANTYCKQEGTERIIVNTSCK